MANHIRLSAHLTLYLLIGGVGDMLSIPFFKNSI